MGYQFWDNEHKRVIQSQDVVFNENTLYKDELARGSSSNKQPKKEEQAELEETSEANIIKPISTLEIGESSGSSGSSDEIGDSQNMEDNNSENEGVETKTPTVHRSTRVRSPPVTYSPSANFLLLTENGKPDSYPEALRMKESIQWKKN